MNRGRPIRRATKPRAVKPTPLPAHAPEPPAAPVDLLAAVLRALSNVPPYYESGGHE